MRLYMFRSEATEISAFAGDAEGTADEPFDGDFVAVGFEAAAYFFQLALA